MAFLSPHAGARDHIHRSANDERRRRLYLVPRRRPVRWHGHPQLGGHRRDHSSPGRCRWLLYYTTEMCCVLCCSEDDTPADGAIELCFFKTRIYTQTSVSLSLSGPVGMAAAAAVATGKKRKRPHVFESNPSIRKRQQTRLLRSASTSTLNTTGGRPIWFFLGRYRYRLLVIKGTDSRYAFAIKMNILVSKLFRATQTPTQNIL